MSQFRKDPASELPSSGANGIQPPVVPSEDAIELSRLLARVSYQIRIKTARGIEIKNVTGSTPEIAKQVADTYVNSEPGRKLLSIAPMYVADESVLKRGMVDKSNPITDELSRQ